MSDTIQLLTASARARTPYSKQSTPTAQLLFPQEGLIQYFLLRLMQPCVCKNECSVFLQVCTHNSVSQVDYMWIKNWWAKNKERSSVLSSTGKWERWHRECGENKSIQQILKRRKNIHNFLYTIQSPRKNCLGLRATEWEGDEKCVIAVHIVNYHI